MLREKRLYVSHKLGAERRMVNSFELVSGESDEVEEIWVREVLMLFRRIVSESKEGAETAYVRFMEWAPPLDAASDALRCVCLRWATAKCEKNESDVNRLKRENTCSAAGEWSGVISFEIILSTVYAFRAYTAVHLSTTELPWSRHRFYTSQFF